MSTQRSKRFRNMKPIAINIISTRELTRSIMVRHGALAEVPFAEGFDILRIVGEFGNRRIVNGGKDGIQIAL